MTTDKVSKPWSGKRATGYKWSMLEWRIRREAQRAKVVTK